jgi:5'-methylthioadenosine phosphorylase
MEVEMDQIKIAVIGGSGLYDIPGMEVISRKNIETPFGKPSDEISIIDVNGVPAAFLPRHGRGHRINPTHVNSRANIFALKTLGVESIISVSAVGSLRENIHPREFVIPDQIIDRTKCRVNSFYDPYAVHVGFADPFCGHLSEMLIASGAGIDVNIHKGGTYVCMEGPLFSTKAESAMHRSWGASIIGMTALPEAKLAREAEICYAAVALVTDYDVWKDDETVELEKVLANIKANTSRVRKLVIDAIPKIVAADGCCSCRTALKTAFFTDPSFIPDETKRAWQPLIGKYIKAD